MLRTPFDLGQLLAPGGAVPDLEVVVDARDDDVAAELRVLEQRAPGCITRPCLSSSASDGAREEEALELPCFLAQRVERREPRLDEPAPSRARV